MAHTEAAGQQPKKRLFTTFADTPTGAVGSKKSAGSSASPPTVAGSAHAPLLSPHHFFSSLHDLSTTSLLLHCISDSHASSGKLEGFDRSCSSTSSGTDSDSGSRNGSSGGNGDGSQAGLLAAALAALCVPGWKALTALPFWRWQLQALLESPCLGVPGLCHYTAARSAWLEEQVRLCVEADNCSQVVVLRAGLTTHSHVLAQPGVKFFEVDSREQVQRKKAALDAVLPGWRHAACRPCFAEVDLLGGSLQLITHLTAAGFDPSRRCCVVAEGLLPYLAPEQGQSLLADLDALAAPGSRLLFDFLHSDALESGGADLPGFASLAAAVAAKGAPLRSAIKPAFSALVRHLQPHQFRLAALLAPHEIAHQLIVAATTTTAGTAAAPAGGSSAPPPSKAATPAQPGVPVGRLPFVPTYFSLAAAVKMDARLLLRHADVAPAGDETSAGLSSWASAAGLTSPSCFVSTIVQLLWGSSSSSSSSSSSDGTSGSSGGAMGAAAAAVSTAPPAQPTAGPSAPPQRQQSAAGWSISAAALPNETAAAPGSPGRAVHTHAGQQGPHAAAGTPSSAPSHLHTALSISPRELEGLPVSRGSRRCDSSAGGSSTGCSSAVHRQHQQQQHQQDSGHLVAAICNSCTSDTVAPANGWSGIFALFS